MFTFKMESVRIQISNYCPLAYKHTLCPTNTFHEVKHLELSLIREILVILKDLGFHGDVGFHIYNEPLVDPRLFSILYFTRDILGNVPVILMTNGENISEVLLKELQTSGDTRIYVTNYRQHPLRTEFVSSNLVTVQNGELDDRLQIYDKPEINLKKPCLAPYRQLTIDCEGNVILCCYDWQSRHKFGNVRDISLAGILLNHDMMKIGSQLSRGNRELDICKRCINSR